MSISDTMIYSQNNFNSLVEIDFGDKDGFDRTLLLWYFEARLKEKYLSFIKALEVRQLYICKNNGLKINVKKPINICRVLKKKITLLMFYCHLNVKI